MRKAGLALISVCMLAACNPSAPGGGGVFPDLTATAYRAEATISNSDGSTMPVVMIRSGKKQRMEFSSPQGQTTIISDGDTGESFVITNAGGQMMAMRTSAADGQFEDPAEQWSTEIAANATRTGSCSVAGQSGAEWTRDVEGVANVVCVTDDGIILRAQEGERTVWETTSVERGPQSAELFTLPPGVEVVDLGAMGQAMQDAMERAKAASGQ